jgi:hypothetical protein
MESMEKNLESQDLRGCCHIEEAELRPTFTAAVIPQDRGYRLGREQQPRGPKASWERNSKSGI